MADTFDMVQTADVADAEKNKGMAILAYIGILFLIPLLAAKDSPFAKYHTNQGLVLFLCSIAIGIVQEMPFIGRLIGPLGGLAILVLMVLGIVNAAQGVMKPLPVIGTIKILN